MKNMGLPMRTAILVCLCQFCTFPLPRPLPCHALIRARKQFRLCKSWTSALSPFLSTNSLAERMCINAQNLDMHKTWISSSTVLCCSPSPDCGAYQSVVPLSCVTHCLKALHTAFLRCMASYVSRMGVLAVQPSNKARPFC